MNLKKILGSGNTRKGFDFEEWLKYFKARYRDTRKKSSALEEMSELVNSGNIALDDLLELYNELLEEEGGARSVIEAKIEEDLLALDIPISDWLGAVYYPARRSKNLMEILLKKLEQSTASLGVWDNVVYSIGDELHEIAVRKMAGEAQTYEEWGTVYDAAYKQLDIQALALKKISALATGVGELFEVYSKTVQEEEKQKIRQRITELAMTLEEWLKISDFMIFFGRRSVLLERELKTIKLEEISKRATTLNDWFKVLDTSFSSKNQQKIATVKMLELAASPEDWFNIYDKGSTYHTDQSEYQKKIAREKILSMIPRSL